MACAGLLIVISSVTPLKPRYQIRALFLIDACVRSGISQPLAQRRDWHGEAENTEMFLGSQSSSACLQAWLGARHSGAVGASRPGFA